MIDLARHERGTGTASKRNRLAHVGPSDIGDLDVGAATIAADVRRGLTADRKWLPPHLFYDAHGSELYERITELPEYYPTRTERAIFEAASGQIVADAAADSADLLQIAELGAGTATKSEVLLRAVVARQGSCRFMPIDVSVAALRLATQRLAITAPDVTVLPRVSRHRDAFGEIASLGPRQLVLFIGSSIGNFEDDQAVALLAGVRDALAEGGVLLLGADSRKSPEVLVPAYDDAQGVTAAFNRNVLTRINRELGADFAPLRFRHVALWNEEQSRIEMHLESATKQTVHIAGLGINVTFDTGERIHTESSIKYDQSHVDRLFAAAGLRREQTYRDADQLFAVYLARRV